MTTGFLPLPSRRDVLGLVAASAVLPWPGGRAAAQGEAGGEAARFSFDALTGEMRAAAGRPWTPAPVPDAWWGDLDYDGYRMIRFRDWRARWQEDPAAPWRLQAYHMGWLYPEPVRVFDVAEGRARPVSFTTEDFDYFGNVAAKVPADGIMPGVAGIKLTWPLNRPDRLDEVASFVGASYFRALGRDDVYGASARGIALNTWVTTPEEFPRFTRFFVSRDQDTATVWAALEGPSVAGAYRFLIRPGAVTEMDVTARLFFREAVEQLGVAPITSMFLFSGQNRAAFDDYRPNVHDSDGLRVVRADGDAIWRPLSNPASLASSYFAEVSPRRFGLYQRDRTFESYQDPGARYDLRPSVEVVPAGEWGNGAVRLVEIPTAVEANDNIVAFWVPEGRIAGGDEREFAYTLRWGDLAPDPGEALAAVVETRAGAGGVSGTAALENARKFAVDFQGGPLAALTDVNGIVPVPSVSGGQVVSATLDRLPASDLWRVVLDVAAERGATVEMSVHLAGFGERLTETWAYQWVNA